MYNVYIMVYEGDPSDRIRRQRAEAIAQLDAIAKTRKLRGEDPGLTIGELAETDDEVRRVSERAREIVEHLRATGELPGVEPVTAETLPDGPLFVENIDWGNRP